MTETEAEKQGREDALAGRPMRVSKLGKPVLRGEARLAYERGYDSVMAEAVPTYKLRKGRK